MTEARLARDYDIRFGHGLLRSDSANWGRYVVITTPSAWAAVEGELDHEPEGIGFNEWLDRTHLIEVSDSLPDDIDLVVGLGAGRALDHAKLVAKRKGKPLVQVPTVVSTGAIIHGFVADWDGRQIIGQLAVVNCEYVFGGLRRGVEGSGAFEHGWIGRRFVRLCGAFRVAAKCGAGQDWTG